MPQYFSSIFWFCALVGSGMFLIQFIINMCGMGEQEGGGEGGEDALDLRKFKWLSIQAVTGFLMMFGWTAITCQKEFGLQDASTIGIALAAGVFAVFVVRSVFKLANKLKSPGSVYRIEDAIGKEGYVYQRIPKGGRGKVSLSLQNLTHEIDAISHHHEDLPSFVRVKIIEKSDENTVVVAPI